MSGQCATEPSRAPEYRPLGYCLDTEFGPQTAVDRKIAADAEAGFSSNQERDQRRHFLYFSNAAYRMRSSESGDRIFDAASLWS